MFYVKTETLKHAHLLQVDPVDRPYAGRYAIECLGYHDGTTVAR